MAAFVLTFVTPLLLLPAAGYVAWREAPKPVGLVLGTLSLAFPAYAVMVGGDWGDVKKLVETCISDSWSCSRFTP